MNIEKGIPLRPRNKYSNFISGMEEGDSVLVLNKSEYNAVAKALWREGFSVVSRKEETGRRIWKIKRLDVDSAKNSLK